MRICYFCDGYSWDVWGVKRSLYENLVTSGHGVDLVGIPAGIGGRRMSSIAPDRNYDAVFCAHSGMDPPITSIPTVGFGFSDPYPIGSPPRPGPYSIPAERISKYSLYVTSHKPTADAYGAYFFPPCADFMFHGRASSPKVLGASLVGRADHPWHRDIHIRRRIVHRLNDDFDQPVACRGEGWSDGPIFGDDINAFIASSHVGLDIGDEHTALNRRLYEYAANGVPIISYDRPIVRQQFENETEILLYRTYDDIAEHMRRPREELASIGARARLRCAGEHNMRHRLAGLFSWLKSHGF